MQNWLDSIYATAILALLGIVARYASWRGVHSMNILQRYGTPLFLILLVIGMYMIADGYVLVGPGEWEATGGLTGAAIWQAMSLANGQVVFQALMATDYGRFVKRSVSYVGTAGVMLAEMLAIVVVLAFGILLSFTMLRYFTGRTTMPELSATDPGLYFAISMGLLGVFFAVVTQVRINVLNLYSGSLALSTAWDALSPRKIGRPWWMVALLVGSIACYPVNVLQYLDKFLAVTGIMTNTWIFILLADYFICRKLIGYGPTRNIEFREGFVADWNPWGTLGMAAGLAVGAVGVFGLYSSYYASFIAMFVAPIVFVPPEHPNLLSQT